MLVNSLQLHCKTLTRENYWSEGRQLKETTSHATPSYSTLYTSTLPRELGEKYTHCWHISREQLLHFVVLSTRVTTLFPVFSVHTETVALLSEMGDRMNNVGTAFLTTDHVLPVGVAPRIPASNSPASPSVKSFPLSPVYSGPSSMLMVGSGVPWPRSDAARLVFLQLDETRVVTKPSCIHLTV